MFGKLERIAEAGKKARNKFVLGSGVFLAGLSFSPEEAEGQNGYRWVKPSSSYHVKTEGSEILFVNPNTCKAKVVDIRKTKVRDDGGYLEVLDEDGGGGRPWYDDSEYYEECEDWYRSSKSSSRRSRKGSNDSWLKKNEDWLAPAAASAILAGLEQALSESSDEGKKTYQNPNSGINVESIEGNYDRSSDAGKSPSRYENGPGRWTSGGDSSVRGDGKEDNYASWGSHEGDNKGNVRNAQGERGNKPDEKYASWKSGDGKNYRASREKRRVSDVSPSLLMSNNDLKKFGEAPLAGDLYDARQNVRDMQGDSNPIDDFYKTNLERANEYFGCGDPARKESSFLCWEAMPNSNSDYNDLAKIATYKLIPK